MEGVALGPTLPPGVQGHGQLMELGQTAQTDVAPGNEAIGFQDSCSFVGADRMPLLQVRPTGVFHMVKI